MNKIIKRNLIWELIKKDIDIYGKLKIDEFYSEIWDLNNLQSQCARNKKAIHDIQQHCITFPDDWDTEYMLLTYFDLPNTEDVIFFKFLETLVNPMVRSEEEILKYVNLINEYIEKAGCKLEIVRYEENYPIYECIKKNNGVTGISKNLIFASNGPKPKFIIRDMISYEIEITENAEYCLIYDEPTPREGLTWGALKEWWKKEDRFLLSDEELNKSLYSRLKSSLNPNDSPPELILFKTYYNYFYKIFENKLPVLLPQVYLHYDHKTSKERDYQKILERQRMDFLLLLAKGQRVVIEVDGVQHYSDKQICINGKDINLATPKKYSDMVEADRDLKLRGYELYRFGGYELKSKDASQRIIEFFTRLFEKHDVLPRK